MSYDPMKWGVQEWADLPRRRGMGVVLLLMIGIAAGSAGAQLFVEEPTATSFVNLGALLALALSFNTPFGRAMGQFLIALPVDERESRQFDRAIRHSYLTLGGLLFSLCVAGAVLRSSGVPLQADSAFWAQAAQALLAVVLTLPAALGELGAPRSKDDEEDVR